MEPQYRKRKVRPAKLAPGEESTRIPITVKGQRYVSVTGRHSQQTHRRAAERALAAGFTTEKEERAHARTAVIDGIATASADMAKNKEQSKQKK